MASAVVETILNGWELCLSLQECMNPYAYFPALATSSS